MFATLAGIPNSLNQARLSTRLSHLELVQHYLNEAVLLFFFSRPPLLSLPQLLLVCLHHCQLALGGLQAEMQDDRHHYQTGENNFAKILTHNLSLDAGRHIAQQEMLHLLKLLL